MSFVNQQEENNPTNNEKPSNNQKEANSGAKENLNQWGYDLYPERKQGAKYSFSEYLQGKGRDIDKIKCERNVYQCVKESPLVKLLMGALKASGCAVDIRRHISCEECAPIVSGGYDPLLNQIVVCQNVAKNKGLIQGVLTHEMIHMFDYCRNNLDFKNVDHLACTEIRAANLTHCSFLSAFMSGDASFFKIKEAHQDCVKSKALSSVLAVRNISKKEAIDAVERVFPKCYSDLEPIGRRLRRNSNDMYKAYEEGLFYGYDNP